MFNLPDFISVKDLYVGDIAKNGNWVVGCVRSAVPWPYKLTRMKFRKRTIYLLPVAVFPDNQGMAHPAVAVRMDGRGEFRDGQRLLSHFLSSLAWAATQPIEVIGWTGGNLPRSMGGYTNGTIMALSPPRPYLPDPSDPNARLALGFFREGMYLNHVAYQCLSYFKVLNIFLRGGRAQIDWINANVSKVAEGDAKKRIASLAGEDIGDYLYGSNRCAVTHAGGEPTADPENPEDMARLSDDLPLIKALAAIAVEEHFGVKSSTTVWREHLYELRGFRALFGLELVQSIKAGEAPPTKDLPPLPKLSVRLFDKDSYLPFERMSPSYALVGEGMVIVDCRSANELTCVRLGLNFKDERLQIDVMQGIACFDDHTSIAAETFAATQQFTLDYLLNGELEVWDADAQQLMGRCDAFIPVNVDMGRTSENYRARIAEAKAEAVRRSARGEPQ